MVAPYAGAWIEIKIWLNRYIKIWVAPYAGAWIEIHRASIASFLP